MREQDLARTGVDAQQIETADDQLRGGRTLSAACTEIAMGSLGMRLQFGPELGENLLCPIEPYVTVGY